MQLAVANGYMPPEEDALTSTTKLGGTPNFLKITPEAERIVDEVRFCRLCGDPMFLLAQCFCPITTEEEEASGNFVSENRMMYIFVCNTAKCNNGNGDKSVVCVTVQVDHDDEDALNDDGEDCAPALARCPNPDQLPPNTFPPQFLDVSEEPPEEETIIDPTDLEKELIKMAEKNAAAGDIPDEEIKELEAAVDLKDKRVDELFEEFRTRLGREPKQVLRYQRGGEPLFMNPDAVAAKVGGSRGVPPCPDCGGPRAMELQVMPTATYFVRAADFVAPKRRGGGGGGAGGGASSTAKADDGMDFGTITVYTCQSGCLHGRKGVVVREEYTFVEPPPTITSDQREEQRTSFHDFFHKPEEADAKLRQLKAASGSKGGSASSGEDEGSSGGEDSA